MSAALDELAATFVGPHDSERGLRVLQLAKSVASYKAPTPEQVTRHERLAASAANFMSDIVACTPPGVDRATALYAVRQAKMFASAAIALENS